MACSFPKAGERKVIPPDSLGSTGESPRHRERQHQQNPYIRPRHLQPHPFRYHGSTWEEGTKSAKTETFPGGLLGPAARNTNGRDWNMCGGSTGRTPAPTDGRTGEDNRDRIRNGCKQARVRLMSAELQESELGSKSAGIRWSRDSDDGAVLEWDTESRPSRESEGNLSLLVQLLDQCGEAKMEIEDVRAYHIDVLHSVDICLRCKKCLLVTEEDSTIHVTTAGLVELNGGLDAMRVLSKRPGEGLGRLKGAYRHWNSEEDWVDV